MKKMMIGIGLVLLLAGCNAGKKGITVAPYQLEGMEEELVAQAQVDTINYFTLDGKTEGLDLEYVVEVYEKGELVEELFQARGLPTADLQQELISFGLHNVEKEVEVFLSIADGESMTGSYSKLAEEEMANISGSLIDEKMTLKRNEPIYLAFWAGKKEASLSSMYSEDGKIPEDIADYDRAYLFTLTLVDPADE